MSRPPAGLGAPVRPPAMPQRTAPVRPLHPERPVPVPPPAREDRRAIRVAVRARRRAEAAERRRRGALGRPRLVVGGAIGVLVLLIGLPLLLAFGPVFPVRTVSVTGAPDAVADAVRTALRSQLGRPVALVEDRDVAAALARVPAVERFTLVRRPPGTLEVAVVPRVPVLQQRTAGGWALLDAARVTVSVDRGRAAALPALTAPASTSAAAYDSAVSALRALQVSGPVVTAVRPVSADDVRLTLQGGLLVHWGGADRGAAKAEALRAALRGAARGAAEVDVSSPGVVLTR